MNKNHCDLSHNVTVAPTAVTYGEVAGKLGKYPWPDQVFEPLQELYAEDPEDEDVEHAQLSPDAPLSPDDIAIVTPMALSFRASVLKLSMREL